MAHTYGSGTTFENMQYTTQKLLPKFSAFRRRSVDCFMKIKRGPSKAATEIRCVCGKRGHTLYQKILVCMWRLRTGTSCKKFHDLDLLEAISQHILENSSDDVAANDGLGTIDDFDIALSDDLPTIDEVSF